MKAIQFKKLLSSTTNTLFNAKHYSTLVFEKQSHQFKTDLNNTLLGDDFLWPEAPGEAELEVPISTNNHVCSYSIKQTKQALKDGVVVETGAKLNLNTIVKHHQKRLKTLQPHHTHVSSEHVDEMKMILQATDTSGIIFHNNHNFTGLVECELKATKNAFATILSSSGGISIGQSPTPPLGFCAETKNSIIGLTRNPFNPEKTVGSSSGGAAASIASGIGNVAIVEDDGSGSISITAGFTGTISVKPSSKTQISQNLTCGLNGVAVGTITRTLEDAAVVWEYLSLGSQSFLSHVQYMTENHHHYVKNYYQKTKVGFILKFPWMIHPVDPEIETSFTNLFNNASTDLNCFILEREFQFDDPNKASILRVEQLFDEYDFLVIPVVSNVAWKVGQEDPSKLTDFTVNLAHFFNIADCPVITIPLGESSESYPVPFGVQILGKDSSLKSLEELFKFAAAISNYSTYRPRFPQFASLKYCFNSEDQWGFTERDG